MSKNYNIEDFSKMIQCYLDCGRDVESGIKMFKSKYPDREKSLLHLLCNMIDNYDHLKKEKQSVEFINSLNDGIVNYFAKNSHVTIRQAACTFSLPVRYISHIFVEREEEIQEKRQEYEIMREQESLNDSIRETIEKTKQTLKREILGMYDSEEEMIKNSEEKFNIKVEEDESVIENSGEKFNIKVEEDESVIEVSETETADSDNVCKTKTKRKRKKKNSKRGKSNKRRATHVPPHSSFTSSPSNINSTIMDIQMRTPIVYTTRLEEMSIYHKDIDHLENAVIISEILAESKPRFNNTIQRSKRKAVKTICLELMNVVLNKLTNKNKITRSPEKAYSNNDDDDIVDVTRGNDTAQKAYSNNDDDDIVDVTHGNDTAQKGNLLQKDDITWLRGKTDVIVIDNMFSNLRDTYVIGGGKLLEYHCTKLDTDEVEKTRETKFTLNVCCWFGRQQNVEIMWPSDKYPFSRFLKSRHECSLDKCACCCKPLNELKPYFHKPANNDFKYASVEESDAKQNDPILLAALNYKKPVTNENIIIETDNTRSKQNYPILLPALNSKKPVTNENISIKTDNTRSKSHLGIATRVLISDSAHGLNRNEYYEIDGDKDIIRFHVDNQWRSTRYKCKVCTMLAPMSGGKFTNSGSACCKWKRDLLLRLLVSPNSLRFLQNVNRYKYDKCSACNVESIPVKKNTAFSFKTIPRIGHAKVTEKNTFSNFCSLVTPPDVHNTTQADKMPVVTSAFEVKKKVNIQCKEIPYLKFEIGGLKDQEVTNVLNKLMHMHCSVKDDSKIVGVFDSSLQSASTEELQMFAQIIQHMQNRLKVTPLPSGTALSLIAEVIDDFKNCNNQSDFQSELVNQGTIVSSNSNAGDMRPPLPVTSQYQNTLPVIIKEEGCVSDAPHCNNVTFQNCAPVTNTSGIAESIANTFIHNNEVTDKIDTFDKFYRRGKKFYEDAFKSYVQYSRKVEDDDITIPKISSVFSLQGSLQCQKPANESFLTETVSSLPSTSYCNKGNAQNNVIINADVETNVIPYPNSILPPMVQQTGQEMIICDSKTGQLFNLIPVDLNAIFGSSIKQNIVTLQEVGESKNQLKLLPLQSDPVNVSNSNVPTTTASYESMEPESILPDILSDIPKNVIVKQEPCNEDVIVLDSD